MNVNKTLHYIKSVLKNYPSEWLNLTTHRLDIYNESLAKEEFLNEFEKLYNANNTDQSTLYNLPTAYDYIRLGHPLSCILEWTVGKIFQLKPEYVIGFASTTMPILAILRTNLILNKNTRIIYTCELPEYFDAQLLKEVYGFNFELKSIENSDSISEFNGSTVFITENKEFTNLKLQSNVDFYLTLLKPLGSVLVINKTSNKNYISEIQHVRRRETIAMTPQDCLLALEAITEQKPITLNNTTNTNSKKVVIETIQTITNTTATPLIGSSGLSIHYAIMMGLVNYAKKNNPDKPVKFIVPTNCYGGTNDQARRVATCIKNVSVVDLEVDGEGDMVSSLDTVLDQVAQQDAIGFIIAEIPTNPRVEVPNLDALKNVLAKKRTTKTGDTAIEPVFVLDQTFCPNVQFLGNENILGTVSALSYVSGSKFPSGGKCTAGYVTANSKASELLKLIEQHLLLCDNEATPLQYDVLAKQLPSMIERITRAYKNTREFVNYIKQVLPEAKINFVSEALAKQGFTPSVFSLDLPTKGDTSEEKETYKRALNLKLINLMISRIPYESKYCVSYGQLKGCYWTIPATSTQGTTKEADKDYIARVSLSPNMDLELHKKVFLEFVESI